MPARYQFGQTVLLYSTDNQSAYAPVLCNQVHIPLSRLRYNHFTLFSIQYSDANIFSEVDGIIVTMQLAKKCGYFSFGTATFTMLID